MREEWDDECMLAITELILNSNIHEEINKTPLEMKLGSISADAMQKLLDEGVMKTPENATELVRKLNDNLRQRNGARKEQTQRPDTTTRKGIWYSGDQTHPSK
jgi:phage-related tail protein